MDYKRVDSVGCFLAVLPGTSRGEEGVAAPVAALSLGCTASAAHALPPPPPPPPDTKNNTPARRVLFPGIFYLAEPGRRVSNVSNDGVNKRPPDAPPLPTPLPKCSIE